MDVLLIGPAFLDVVAAPVQRLPQPGEELHAAAIELAPGGFAIAAAALSRLGIRAALAAPVGDDGPGRYLLSLLQAEGVELIRGKAQRTPATIALNRAGDRAFLTAGFPADDALREVGLAALREYPACETVHLSCRGPFAEAVALEARAQGRFVSMDCGTDPQWLQSEALRRTLQFADIYLPNAREASLVTGAPDPRAAASALLRLVPSAIVKLGADGVLRADPGGVRHHPTAAKEAIDTTGAGDVFDAGYLAGRVYGFGEPASIRLGQYAAGLSIGALGGTAAAPTPAQARRDLPDLAWPNT